MTSLLSADESQLLYVRRRPLGLLLHFASSINDQHEMDTFSGKISLESFLELKKKILKLAEDSGFTDLADIDSELVDFRPLISKDIKTESIDEGGDRYDDDSSNHCEDSVEIITNEQHASENMQLDYIASDLVSKIVRRVIQDKNTNDDIDNEESDNSSFTENNFTHRKAKFGQYVYIFQRSRESKLQKLYRCNLCEFDSKLINRFATHMKENHHILDAYECALCDSRFRMYNTFKRHSIWHRDHPEKSVLQDGFQVEQIPPQDESDQLQKAEFGRFIYFTNDIHSKNRKIYCCNLCSFDSYHITRFATHMKDVHNVCDAFECSLCDERFESYKESLRHRIWHRDNPTKNFPKHICDKSYEKDASDSVLSSIDCSTCLDVVPTNDEQSIKHSTDEENVLSDRFTESTEIHGEHTTDVSLLQNEHHSDFLVSVNTVASDTCAEDLSDQENTQDNTAALEETFTTDHQTDSPHGRYVVFERTSTGEKRKLFRCNLCRFERRMVQNFASHMREMHGINEGYECPQCYMLYTNYDDYQLHLGWHKSERSNTHTETTSSRKETSGCRPVTRNRKRKIVEEPYVEGCNATGRYVCKGAKDQKIFRCNLCIDFQRGQVSAFAKHMLSEHDIKDAYECCQCFSRFNNLDSYQRHMYWHRDHPNSAPGDLTPCKFSSRIFFQAQNNGTRDLKIYKCDTEDCSFETCQKAIFAAHLLDIHHIIDGFECSKCPYKTPSDVFYKAHVAEHEKIFVEAASLNLEELQHSEENPMQPCIDRNHVHLYHHIDGKKLPVYKCEDCNFSSVNADTFYDHMKLLHTITDCLECHHCPYNCSTLEEFKQHLDQHSTECPTPVMVRRQQPVRHQCELCGYHTPSHKALRCHMRCHNGEFPYLCDKCDYRARKKTSLVKHLADKHGQGVMKVLKCDAPNCNFSTQYKNSLVTHKLRHKKDPRHSKVCEACGFVAKFSQEFLRHVKIHLEMKEFQCPFCPYMDYDQQSVRKHIAAQHTNETEFVCEYCQKSAVSAAALKFHLMSHEGIKPWQCDTCLTKFAEKAKFKKHNSSKHDDTAHVVRLEFKLKAQVQRNVSQLSSQVFRIHYNYRELENGTIELYISGKSRVLDKEVQTLQCETCSYFTRSGNAFVLHKIMDHTDCLKFLPPITDQTRRIRHSDNETRSVFIDVKKESFEVAQLNL